MDSNYPVSSPIERYLSELKPRFNHDQAMETSSEYPPDAENEPNEENT